MPLRLALPLFVFPREETLPLTFFCSEISQAYIIIKSVRRAEENQVSRPVWKLQRWLLLRFMGNAKLRNQRDCVKLAFFAYSMRCVTKDWNVPTSSIRALRMCNSIVLEHFSVDSRKRIETVHVVWMRIDRSVFDLLSMRFRWDRKRILLKTTGPRDRRGAWDSVHWSWTASALCRLESVNQNNSIWLCHIQNLSKTAKTTVDPKGRKYIFHEDNKYVIFIFATRHLISRFVQSPFIRTCS